jgi:hypothetical protein
MPNAESPYLPTRLRSFLTFRPAALLVTLASLLIPSIALAQTGSYVEKTSSPTALSPPNWSTHH